MPWCCSGVAAANRDPARFAAPDDLDVTRDAAGHVAFGRGLHFCLGAELARIQGAVAIGALLERHPGLALDADPDELTHRRSSLVRGLTALPVRLGWRRPYGQRMHGRRR